MNASPPRFGPADDLDTMAPPADEDPGDKCAYCDVLRELAAARERYKPFNSAHEGYAILFEEVDELWAEVRKKPSQRSKERLRAEAVQVAAMALRFIQDICDREPSDE